MKTWVVVFRVFWGVVYLSLLTWSTVQFGSIWSGLFLSFVLWWILFGIAFWFWLVFSSIFEYLTR